MSPTPTSRIAAAKAAATSPSALTAPQVRTLMLAKAAGSALTPANVAVLKLTPMLAAEAAALKLPAAAAGFRIPYFDLRGQPTKFYRVRYVQDTRRGFERTTGKKPLRYAQPTASVTEVYLPPLVDWEALAGNPAVPLIITEGELKAACATAHGLPTIGLGGVWSFQSARNGESMLPIFDTFALQGRPVYIVFDSDAVTNPMVVAAELRLARRLTERGAHVYIGRLTASEELNKVGLDDYIVFNGAGALKERVLEEAFEYAASEKLHELNRRVLYVRDPGFIWDHEVGMRVAPAAFTAHAFSNYFYDETRTDAKGNVRIVKVPAAPAWLQWPHRAEVPGLTFTPGADRITDAGMLNTWTGWGVKAPHKGDMEPWHELMTHLFGGDPAARVWFERWCAAPLQKPGLKQATAAAIWGTTHGSGKTLVGHTLMRIYGKHASELKDTDLDDERNEWADSRQFVLADDITARGDRAFMRRLMTMITQKWIRLNPKFIGSYMQPDLINYYFTSNDPDALYMDDGDRRFFIWEVTAGKFLNYKRYVEWRDSDDGIAALWYYLLNLDMGDYDPQAPAPDTAGKRSMIYLGKSDLGSWVRELRDNAEVMLKRAGMKGDLFSAKELMALYDPSGDKRTTVNALAREVKRAGFHPPANGSPLHCPDGSQVAVYAILNGAAWRSAKWRDACTHYITNRPQGLWDIKRSKL